MSKAEQTREFIIERIAPIFNAKGFAGTSLSDLTEATGLTKGGIYGNFRNKDEVALAAFDYNFGRVTAYLKERILAEENAIARLLVYPRVYRNFLKIPFLKTGRPTLNPASEAYDTHPVLKKTAADALRFWKKTLESQVKRGIERGEIRSEAEPAKIAVLMMALIEGAVLQAKVLDHSRELEVTMDFLEYLIHDLKP